MSAKTGELVSQIIFDVFDSNVQAVVECLNSNQFCTMKVLCANVELPGPQSEITNKVRDALRLLIQFTFVEVIREKKSMLVYYLNCDRISKILRYPRYLNLIRKKYDEDSEIIIKLLMCSGLIRASDVIMLIADSLDGSFINQNLVRYRDKFSFLVASEYLIRGEILKDGVNCEFRVPEYDTAYYQTRFEMPDLELNNLLKRVNTDDEDIFWCLNISKFDREIRDDVIFSSVFDSMGDNYLEMIKFFFERMYMNSEAWCKESNPVSVNDLRDAASQKQMLPYLALHISNYLTILSKEKNPIIRHFGDASGGQYTFDMVSMFERLSYCVIEQIISKKYGSNSARIFRLVRDRSFIEPDHIQKFAMIPAKDCKSIIYLLIQEGYLKIKEFRRSSSNVPFVFLYIDFVCLVREAIQMYYKSIRHLYIRKCFESDFNHRLIDNCDDDHDDLREISNLKNEAVSTQKKTDKLNIAIFETDRTLFILELFLKFKFM